MGKSPNVLPFFITEQSQKSLRQGIAWVTSGRFINGTHHFTEN